MRAKFINEKFTEDSDPIKDMGIGHSSRVLNSKTFKLLQYIGSKGDEGVSFTQIQYYIWNKLNGNDPHEFWEKDYSGKRKTRGYWATQLYGTWSAHEGILHKYCEKNEKGNWVLVRMPKPNENLYVWE